MKQSEQLNELGKALSAAQAKMQGAKKDTSNPFFKSKYADLASCVDASREALCSEGLSVIQANTPAEGGIMVQTRILHSSGQWIEEDGLFVPAAKHDPQGYGSALTYARRYSLCAMVGIAPEDDDGNAAVKAKAKPEVKGHITPNDGVAESLDAKTKDLLHSVADDICSRFNGVPDNVGAEDAAKVWYAIEGTTEEKIYIWNQIPSNHRAAIKKAGKK